MNSPHAQPTYSGRWFVAVWLALIVVFLGSHFDFYFRHHYVELGDWAANALQIFNAKHFRELYGQYSRWGFHHPGPAFFYVYAIGERLFRDSLRLAPSPFTAHTIAGTILQSGFFVWTLAILDRQIRHRLLVPLLLVLATLHFGAMNYNVRDSAFSSIWSGHVLLFPFLCLLVSGAALASGSAPAVLPMTIAAGFLLHAHVAQPLFVGTITCVAIIGFTRHWRPPRGSGWAALKSAPVQSIAALFVCLLFATPFVIDLLRGNDSNVHAILGHFGRHNDDHKTLAQSLVYLATFFCYVPDSQTFCDTLTSGSFRFVRERWPFLLVWFAIFGAVFVALRKSIALSSFARWLASFFAIATALTIVWGMLQTGPLFNFNSHFNFGVMFVPLALLAIGICNRVTPSNPRVQRTGIVCFVIAVPLSSVPRGAGTSIPSWRTYPRT